MIIFSYKMYHIGTTGIIFNDFDFKKGTLFEQNGTFYPFKNKSKPKKKVAF